MPRAWPRGQDTRPTTRLKTNVWSRPLCHVPSLMDQRRGGVDRTIVDLVECLRLRPFARYPGPA
jgi:hypothetical protein